MDSGHRKDGKESLPGRRRDPPSPESTNVPGDGVYITGKLFDMYQERVSATRMRKKRRQA